MRCRGILFYKLDSATAQSHRVDYVLEVYDCFNLLINDSIPDFIPE